MRRILPLEEREQRWMRELVRRLVPPVPIVEVACDDERCLAWDESLDALAQPLELPAASARRQREMRQMQSSLSVGDEVMLTSGIYGVVRSLDDERVRVEVAPGAVIEVARGAVGQRVSPSAAAPGEAGTDTEPPAPHDHDDTTGER